MPARAMKGCTYPGCTNLIEAGPLCHEHRSARNKARDDLRGSSTDRGYGANWQKIRSSVLAETPLCADPFEFHANEERVELAAEVDHIVPKAKGGTDDPENLQALCERCHKYKTSNFDSPRFSKRYMRSLIPVSIIAGAPGSGKTSYVKAHAHWGDLIIDLDAIYSALSGLPWYEKPDGLMPFVLAVRDALLRQLSHESTVRQAWFITSEGRRSALDKMAESLGANIVVMDTGYTECIRRISQDERRKGKWQMWQPIVERWFKRYQSFF